MNVAIAGHELLTPCVRHEAKQQRSEEEEAKVVHAVIQLLGAPSATQDSKSTMSHSGRGVPFKGIILMLSAGRRSRSIKLPSKELSAAPSCAVRFKPPLGEPPA